MTANRTARRQPALIILLVLLLPICGCQESQEDRTAYWLESAERILSEVMLSHFTNPVYDTQWDREHANLRLDDERFPAWARDGYDACVYWHTTFWTEVYNDDRRPGNSSVFIRKPGEGWGWILLADQGFHILELGYQFTDEESEPIMLIEVWNLPSEDTTTQD